MQQELGGQPVPVLDGGAKQDSVEMPKADSGKCLSQDPSLHKSNSRPENTPSPEPSSLISSTSMSSAPVIHYGADDAIAALDAAIRANEDEETCRSTAAAHGAREAVLAIANSQAQSFPVPDFPTTKDEHVAVLLEGKRSWAPEEFIVEPDRLTMTLHDNEKVVVYPNGIEHLNQRYEGLDVTTILRGERIGEGTYAGIYKAHLAGKVYAVKTLHSIEASEMHLRNAQHSIKNEIYYALHAFHHDNVVPSYQVWWEDGGLHILMDYVDLSLAFLADRLGPLREHILSHISLQMLHGLSSLRQNGLVHQDINAENILIGYDGMVKLCDFGMISVHPEWQTGQSAPLPLPAPGSNDYKKWDTCSMGLMLVQCAAGIQRHLVMSLLDQEGGVDFDPIVERHFKGKGLKPPSNAMKDFIAKCVALCSCEELLQHPFITNHSTSVASTSVALESWLQSSKNQLVPAQQQSVVGYGDGPGSGSARSSPVAGHPGDLPPKYSTGPSVSPYSSAVHQYGTTPPSYAPPYNLAVPVSASNPGTGPHVTTTTPGGHPPPRARMVPVGGVATARANAGYAAAPRVAPVLPVPGAHPMYPPAHPHPEAYGHVPHQPPAGPPTTPPMAPMPAPAMPPAPARPVTPPPAPSKEKAGKIICRKCQGPHFTKDCTAAAPPGAKPAPGPAAHPPPAPGRHGPPMYAGSGYPQHAPMYPPMSYPTAPVRQGPGSPSQYGQHAPSQRSVSPPPPHMARPVHMQPPFAQPKM